MEKIVSSNGVKNMGITTNKLILAQCIFWVSLLIYDLTSEETKNNDLNKQLNRVESCIESQEKYRGDLEKIDIADLKSCVFNSQKLTKNELDNILNI